MDHTNRFFHRIDMGFVVGYVIFIIFEIHNSYASAEYTF